MMVKFALEVYHSTVFSPNSPHLARALTLRFTKTCDVCMH